MKNSLLQLLCLVNTKTTAAFVYAYKRNATCTGCSTKCSASYALDRVLRARCRGTICELGYANDDSQHYLAFGVQLYSEWLQSLKKLHENLRLGFSGITAE